jgi:hypothetical protein
MKADFNLTGSTLVVSLYNLRDTDTLRVHNVDLALMKFWDKHTTSPMVWDDKKGRGSVVITRKNSSAEEERLAKYVLSGFCL